MIVRIPSNDSILYNDYQELFRQASEQTGKNISTISTYFEALQGEESLLRAYEDGKFLRIPLDEGLFEIDANTREIKIPDEFDPKKNRGIGVQGDHLAEILFFKIARYFDEMDFDTCDCHIEWINARGDKMYSPAYAKQLVIDDEVGNDCSIIFGWIIDQNLMALEGTVQFAVRFVQHQNPEDVKTPITFNFMTSPATLKVLPCLPVEYNSLIESDYRQVLSARPMYSGVVSYTGIKPVITDYTWEGMPFVNLRNGSFELVIEAKDLDSPDAEKNSLVYQWYKDNAIIANATSDSYTATSNGEYYVMIGNEQDTGTTWVQSQICRIPAAGPVSIGLAEGTALKGYSDGEDKITNLVAIGTVPDGNIGTLTYTWHEDTKDEIVGNAAQLNIADKAYGNYYADVKHELNNSTPTNANMKDDGLIVIIRPHPVTPNANNLEIQYDEITETYVCVESSGMDDLQYRWTFSDFESEKEIAITGKFDTTNSIAKKDLEKLVGEIGPDDILKVEVRQVRFENETIFSKSTAVTVPYKFE